MLHKYEMAAILGRRFGLRSYLEIATATTGYEFSCIDSNQFPIRKRAMYYCPSSWSDGAPIHFRTIVGSSRSLDIEGKYDLVFVDAWHEYANASEDLALAMMLVSPTGVVLVHDCNPENEEKAQPKLPDECAPGHCDRPWSGESYAAFLDLVLSTEGVADYFTIDDDHGCGVIFSGLRMESLRSSDELFDQWKMLQPNERFAFFHAHRADLLRLKSPEWFLETMGEKQ